MARAVIAKHMSTYPIYATDWSASDFILIGGGGGASSTGIPNALTVCKLQKPDASASKQQLDLLYTHSTGSGAVGGIAVHPKKDEILCVAGGSVEGFAFGADAKKSVKPLRGSSSALPLEKGAVPQRFVVFSPDGKLFAVVAEDKDCAEDEEVQKAGDDAAAGEARKKEREAARERDQLVVRVYEYESMQLVARFKSHSKTVYDASFSPAGDFLATASADHTCAVWAVPAASAGDGKRKKTGEEGVVATKPAATLKCPRQPAKSAFRGCRFSKDGKFLYTAQSERQVPAHVTRWRAGAWEEEATAVAHPRPITCFAASSRVLAVGAADGSVALLSAEGAMRRLAEVPAHLFVLTGLAFSPDEARLVSVSADAYVAVTDVALALRRPAPALPAALLLLALLALLLALLLAPEHPALAPLRQRLSSLPLFK
eukprot:tig00001278_g7981.t1